MARPRFTKHIFIGGPFGFYGKECSHCKQLKELSEYTIGSDKTCDGLASRCSSCNGGTARIGRFCESQERREHRLAGMRKRRLERQYGMTIEQFEAMKRTQGGMCPICGEEPKRWVVDHNHSDGSVRQLLCDLCNSGVGMFRESVAILRGAIAYIERHG